LLAVLERILRAVDHVHSHGVAHRNLTASAVHLIKVVDDSCDGSGGGSTLQRATTTTVVKISGFGDALDCRHYSGTGAAAANRLCLPFQHGSMPRGGDPTCLPPEITSRKAGPNQVLNYDKADVFAAGMIAAQMAAGKSPFSTADARQYNETTLGRLPSGYSAQTRRFVRWLLNPSPDRRPQPSEAREALSRIMGPRSDALGHAATLT
jgi:serine/threonine protein kinase